MRVALLLAVRGLKNASSAAITCQWWLDSCESHHSHTKSNTLAAFMLQEGST